MFVSLSDSLTEKLPLPQKGRINYDRNKKT